MSWQTRALKHDYDALAPDGSEIRLLAEVSGGSMVHCTLPPGAVSRPVRHRSVEELWYCVAGQGQLWRQKNNANEIVDLKPGVSVSIPIGTEFQFRAERDATLELVITTIPPWPGEEEAMPVDNGNWRPTR